MKSIEKPKVTKLRKVSVTKKEESNALSKNQQVKPLRIDSIQKNREKIANQKRSVNDMLKLRDQLDKILQYSLSLDLNANQKVKLKELIFFGKKRTELIFPLGQYMKAHENWFEYWVKELKNL